MHGKAFKISNVNAYIIFSEFWLQNQKMIK